jgi:hypothetical protein
MTQDGMLKARSKAVLLQETPTVSRTLGISMVDTESLLTLAIRHFEFIQVADSQTYAVPHEGPCVAIPLREGAGGFASTLKSMAFHQQGTIPTRKALKETLDILEVKTGQTGRVAPLPIRVGSYDGGSVLDLGDHMGTAVLIRPMGWELVARSPIPFERTMLTQPLPEPDRDGTTEDLLSLLSVPDDYKHLVVGLMVSSLIPDIPHPPLLLTGEQGSGKSWEAAKLVYLLDPSYVPLRGLPSSLRDWVVTARASWVSALDNQSNFPQWFSDALCRICTGEGFEQRRLFTDMSLSAASFKRIAIVTGIDIMGLRPDLADRAIIINMPVIPDRARMPEADLSNRLNAMRPRALGALLTLTSQVLEHRPQVRAERLPRMADFGQVLATLDSLFHTHTLETYRNMIDDAARDLVAGDRTAEGIRDFILSLRHWVGTPTELLNRLHDAGVPGLPHHSQAIAGVLKRYAEPFRRMGFTVERATRPNGHVQASIRLEAPPDGRLTGPIPLPAASPQPAQGLPRPADDPQAVPAETSGTDEARVPKRRKSSAKAASSKRRGAAA